MWQKIASSILRNRLAILIGLAVLTTFMGYRATSVELQYEFGKLLPEDDSTNLEYLGFREKFGQDGLVIVISTEAKDFYTLDKFNKWKELGDRLSTMTVEEVGAKTPNRLHPIDSVFSEAHLYNITKDKPSKSFILGPVTPKKLTSEAQVDSIRDLVRSLPFYENIVYKDSSDIHLMMVFVNQKVFNSKSRGSLVGDLHDICMEYNADFGEMHFSGLPFIRSRTMEKVKSELGLFVVLALLVTALILFIFYRSFKVVVTSLTVVAIGVIWSVGTISLFGYKLSILMGLMPPLMIVIGIPNCVYLITKYQQEFLAHGNKAKALTRVIKKVGNATFLTNATTAMGFATFLLTESSMMREFGLIAAINIMALFFISILVVPILYSYFKAPKERHTKHFDKKWLDKAVTILVNLTTNHRTAVYITSFIIIILGGYGISLMRTSGNIVDDLPKGDVVVQDLKYFEKEFNGVMPFEVLIRSNDTIYKSYRNIKAVDSIQTLLEGEDKLSKSISLVNGIKYISQAYSNGSKEKYVLRDEMGLQNIMKSAYFKNSFSFEDKENSSQFLGNFLDDSHTETRITLSIKDVGIDTMEAVLSRVKAKIESVIYAEKNQLDIVFEKNLVNKEELKILFNNSAWVSALAEEQLLANNPELDEFAFLEDEELIYTYANTTEFKDMLYGIVDQQKLGYTVTGSGVTYTKGTTYLVGNLFTSLLAAIFVIALLMSFLFRSWRMVIVSLIPNILPLVFTSGLMGFLGIPIKPSTILVFSIAFGISVDDTIHFLAKYRQELKNQSWNIKGSVMNALTETGVSMIYTSIILFFGFSIFIASNFGGTQALGVLVSVTLFVAMLANLVLLPSLLLSLEKYVTTKEFRDPQIDFDYEEDEDVDLEELQYKEIKKTEHV